MTNRPIDQSTNLPVYQFTSLPFPIMSSFSNPHYMYLFDLRSGRQKLAYGESPEDALTILKIRLSEQEMDEIVPDRYIKVNQRELRQYIGNLG